MHIHEYDIKLSRYLPITEDNQVPAAAIIFLYGKLVTWSRSLSRFRVYHAILKFYNRHVFTIKTLVPCRIKKFNYLEGFKKWSTEF